MYKGLKAFTMMIALGIAVVVPANTSAIQGSASSENITENDTSNTVKSSTSDDSSDIKLRGEKIKKDIESLKNLAKDKKEKAKELILDKVKQAAIKAIDSTIKKLNKIKDRVAKMKNISDALKTELNAKIDDRIALLESKKAAVETSTTKEEVDVALGDAQKELRSTKDIIKSVVEAIHKTHLQNIITRLEKVLTKLEGKAAALTNTKKVEADAVIAQARAYLETAKTNITGGNLIEAKDNIKKAHKEIVKLLSKVKINKANDIIEEEVSDE